MGDMGTPPLAGSSKKWYDHAGRDSRSRVSSGDHLSLGGDVKSVDLVFFIFSYQYYIGIMNSYKKKACISCVYNDDDLPSNNSSLHSSHMIFIYSQFHGFITNQFNDLLPVGLLA